MEKFETFTSKVNETMTAVKKKLDTFVSQDEAFWMAVAMFLFGVIVGMFISPRKTKVTTIGSNNGNGCLEDEDYCDDDCCCDDEECE